MNIYKYVNTRLSPLPNEASSLAAIFANHLFVLVSREKAILSQRLANYFDENLLDSALNWHTNLNNFHQPLSVVELALKNCSPTNFFILFRNTVATTLDRFEVYQQQHLNLANICGTTHIYI